MPDLVEAFRAHCADQQRVAPSLLLAVHVPRICSVLAFIDAEPSAEHTKRNIERIFRVANWMIDPKMFQTFVQLIGEAQFWKMANERGVKLDRIPERKNEMTPDFRLSDVSGLSPCFEVKTLSVVDGEFNLARMDEASFEAQLSLSAQVGAGRAVASATASASPHGAVENCKAMTTIIRNLVKKAENNIKPGQFANAPTLLVLNLMLLDGYYNGKGSLRPVTCIHGSDWQLRSGAYWNLAFGQPGHLVFGLPEFEGKPGVEGSLDCEGILSAHPEICALLLIVHDWEAEPKIYGLARELDTDRWLSDLKPLGDAFVKLAGENWNDDRDTLGWRLTDK